MRVRRLCVAAVLTFCTSAAGAQEKDLDKAAQEELWKTATYKARAGDLVIAVASARIAKVPVKDLGRQSQSREAQLMVFVAMRNTSDTKKLDYKGWSTKTFDLQRTMVARASDELGNVYKRIGFGFGSDIVGQLKEGESVYPEKTLVDLLVFEVPIAKAKEIRLLLPGEAIGWNTPIRLKFNVGKPGSDGDIFSLTHEVKLEEMRRETEAKEAEAARLAEIEAKKTPEQKAADRKKAEEEAAEKAKQVKLAAEQKAMEIAREKADKDEQTAASKMKNAESLLAAGKRDSYRKILKEIVDKYPETAAGKKAAKALKK